MGRVLFFYKWKRRKGEPWIVTGLYVRAHRIFSLPVLPLLYVLKYKNGDNSLNYFIPETRDGNRD